MLHHNLLLWAIVKRLTPIIFYSNNHKRNNIQNPANITMMHCAMKMVCWFSSKAALILFLFITFARCHCLSLHVCMHSPCLGFSRWNHGMEVISHSIPLWTVIRCRQCAMDPKGLPSAYFRSLQRWENAIHLVVVSTAHVTYTYGPNSSFFFFCICAEVFWTVNDWNIITDLISH